MKLTKSILLVAVCILSTVMNGAEITCRGVLGNSGVQGDDLVLFGGGGTNGFNVVCDEAGTLWDRGGSLLNRYALDGRLLASYELPKGRVDRNSDMIVLADKTLIIRLDGQLYSLAIDASPDAKIKSMKIRADKLSPTALKGWVIASDKEDVFLVNGAGDKKPVAKLTKSPQAVVYGPEGDICVQQDWKIYKVVPDKGNALELVGPAPGERPVFLDGYWYGSAWHSTLRRQDEKLNPSPGVVLGGNSGSFIGHVAEQAEVINGRGLAKINDNLFAISGFGGVVHLLEWKGEEKRFEPLRRIGALQSCDALALDNKGRIWCRSGNWNWSDGPLTPMHFGVPEPVVFALTVMPNNELRGYGSMWGRPMFVTGNMDKEVRLRRLGNDPGLPKKAVAVALTELKKRRGMLILQADGKCTAVYINGDGGFNRIAGPVKFETKSPVKKWTSLVATGKDALLAAGDGQVIELVRNGDSWKETRRWNSVSDADTFGQEIFLSLNSGKLWVSDTKRSRVLCFNYPSGKLLGSYGVKDSAGKEISKLSSPKVINACGNRAVVYDAGNQRILKLEIR